MPTQPRLIAEETGTYRPAQDQQQHAAYRERLREKLQDPEFRRIKGFPIGEDEAILALSDPPYYTACPNPFLPEIVARWREERRVLRAELGLPDDFVVNGYSREPFAADVSEGKNDPIYNAHSYHTKVPHKAIMRYILHYTDPGDVVFDGFCGTGMTGVAAQLCGDRKAVESLGYRVDAQGIVYDGNEPISRLGARKAVLVDLSPAATFIAYNYNTPVEVDAFEREAERILDEVEEECRWMYETIHTDRSQKGRVKYVIWSDVFSCPHCSAEIIYWDTAVDAETKSISNQFPCPQCIATVNKRSLQRQWETYYDAIQDGIRSRMKRVPVLINYSIGKNTYEKRLDESDIELIRRIEMSVPQRWFPVDKMMFREPPWGDQWREGYHADVTHTHHFYSRRSLDILASFYSRAVRSPLRTALLFALTSVLKYSGWMNRISPSSTMGLFRTRSGTLYIGSITGEINLLDALRSKSTRTLKSLFDRMPGSEVLVSTGSTETIHLPENCIDYIFVDPPFGSNLAYAELNFLWESWLRVFTQLEHEVIVSTRQQKRLSEYQGLMTECFREMYRILKPGRWITVEFHNSQNTIWRAIQEALLMSGFIVADVRMLDKVGHSFNAINASSAVNKDLIISAYKSPQGFEQRFQTQGGSEAGTWTFIEEHLRHLPVPQLKENRLDILAERQAYLLYDRMVAFHVQRGLTVPLSAAEFYAGLKERYSERDGMYFLPPQAAEYDRLRLQAQEVQQLPLIVTDEKTAILWLRQQLEAQPQTFQEIQPKFLRELHQLRHEKMPELRDLLEDNFLEDAAGRWYVPDPNRAQDLERWREKSLLREFAAYLEGRGRLKLFRSEAVRAGFRDAWRRRDYTAIVKVAERLPSRVLQEDQDLLMYYDNALNRVER